MSTVVARIAVLLFLLPAFVGCLGEGDQQPTEAAVVPNAAEVGAKSGESPVAPKEAYAVDTERTAYPVEVDTTSARAPVTVDFSGTFQPSDCRPFQFGPGEAVLSAASVPQRGRDLSEELRVGDVFSYNVTLSFTNTDSNWAEVHAAYGLGSTVRSNEEPTQDMRDVLITFEGQGYRASEEDMAWLFIACHYGMMTAAIPYTYTATFTFAEGAVPAEAPMLLTVPEGATRMFVRGVAIDGDEGVQSHFRVFKPDDTLLCECALGSNEEVAEIALPEPGEYVIIVDHTGNGFVSVALDAPSDTPLRALGSEWVETLVLSSDGGAVDATVDVNLERVPLVMFAHVIPKDGAGAGKHTTLTMTNGRGEPLRASWGGHLAWTDPVGGNAWLGYWPDDWEYVVDHHAFAQGLHVAHVTAEELRGEVYVITRQYVR